MNFFLVANSFLFLVLISRTFSQQQQQQQENPRRCRRRGDDGMGGGGGGNGLPDSCQTNSHGYMCCEMGLEDVVMQAVDEMKADKAAQGEKFSSCNMQAMANKIGQMAETRFNTSFETVIGVSNFASKTRFFGNFMCKVKAANKVILTYGTAKSPPPPPPDVMQPAQFQKVYHTYTWRL